MSVLFHGVIAKMTAKTNDGLVHYSHGDIDMNALIGKNISFSYQNATTCMGCGVLNQPVSQDGHCPLCCKSKAATDICIVKPELCHYDAGTCREPQWGESNCMASHTVYLSVTSGVKVGITRSKNLLQRWVDQGATQAIRLFTVDKRITAGLIEQVISSVMADKTNWRKMLTGETSVDLNAVAAEISPQIQMALALYGDVIERTDNTETRLKFPVTEYPTKVSSGYNLDKTPAFTGKLIGIKGQYLILDTGVFNWRKHIGHHLTMTELPA